MVRLGSAKQMPLYSDLPINKIATRCGYNNVYYFFNTFRNFQKISPMK